VPEVVVFLLRAVVLVLLWAFVIAAIVAIRHDVFGSKAARNATKPRPVPVPVPAGAPRAAAPVVPPAPAPKATPVVAAPPPTRKRRGSNKAPQVAARLSVIEGPHAGISIPLSSLPVTIGRADDASIVLADDYVSNHHARLIPRGPEWLIEDTGSTNGTFVGDKKVTTAVVVPVGGRVRIGHNVLEVQA
jgi:Inner membrane component of T3SS, cytoplasmic domain